MLLPTLLFSAVTRGPVQAGTAVSYNVRSSEGLTVRIGDVPVVKGSWWQYYEPGWVKGYYVSQESRQTVHSLGNGNYEVSWNGAEGNASGSQVYTKTAHGVRVDYAFDWKGPNPVMVELCGGLLWAPAFEHGKLTIDGKPARSLARRSYASASEMGPRNYGENASTFEFAGALGSMRAEADTSQWQLFDARGYVQNWALQDDIWWFGAPAIEVRPGATTKVSLEWGFEPNAAPRSASLRRSSVVKPLSSALAPSAGLPMVPKPQSATLSDSQWYTVGTDPELSVPESERATAKRIREMLGRLWRPTAKSGKVTAKVADMGMRAEGYKLTVARDGVRVVGQDVAGLRHGLYRLAMLARPVNGELRVPCGQILDWPSLSWRGVHMFVGPHAREFHQKLFERALLPVGLNKAVFQCERTDWKATPGIATSITMPKEELRKEFDMLRDYGIEPIPMIQSFGHMEWIFENKQNADLAIDPQHPYTVNPDNPRTSQLLGSIWDEAANLLHPKIMHFGLDEVAMLGSTMGEDRVTSLWKKQVSFLDGLAKKSGAQPMFWSDVALAPGEATDATSAANAEVAAERRAVMPKGALIGDWHYAPVSDPEKFRTSLKIWKASGQVPIASTWYLPENIRSFTLAAIKEQIPGILQTTWAGYESTESVMLGDWTQFGAYLLAADYAWSGRTETPSQLGYDPQTLLRRLYLVDPRPVAGVAGWSLLPVSPNSVANLADVRFRLFGPIELRSSVDPAAASAPESVEFAAKASASCVAFALDCRAKGRLHEPVCEVVATLASGKAIRKALRYGDEIRAADDTAGLVFGDRAGRYSVARLQLGEASKLRSITVRSLNSYSGVRLYGVSGW